MELGYVFKFTAYTNSIISLIIGLFTLFTNIKKKLNILYFSFSISICLYAVFFAQSLYNPDPIESLLQVRIFHVFCFFLVSFNYLFIHEVIYRNTFSKPWHFTPIIIAVIGSYFTLFGNVIAGVEPVGIIPNWTIIGNQFWIYLIPFLISSIGCLTLLGVHYFKTTGKRKAQIKWIFISLFVGTVGGFTTFLPAWGIKIEPHGFHFIFLLHLGTGFCILKYELFDFKATLSRTSSFLITSILYIIASGYTFYFYLWITEKSISNIDLVILSIIIGLIIGSSINKLTLILQKTAEKTFLKGWYDYKVMLFKFSILSNKSSNLPELIQNIYTLFSEDIEISNIQIFIPEWFEKFKETSRKLIYYPNKNSIKHTPYTITKPLLNFIYETKKSIYKIEDVKHTFTDKNNELYKNINFILASYNEEKEIISLILIGKKMSEKKYTNEDFELLKTLANQITPAILKIKQIRLNGEIEIAQKIQSEIIPQNHTIPNCTTSAYLRSSDEVGGDFYDIHKKDNNNWIILGDVTGHGIGSGMVMLMIQSIFSSLIHSSKLTDPALINREANKILCQNFERLSEPRPISLVTLNTKDGKTFKFHGNHENLFIYKKHDKKVIHHSINHLPFGIGLTDNINKNCFTSSTIELSEGDILLLATDGLTEACKDGNPKKEQFNDNRVKNILESFGTESTENIKSALIETINTFTNKVFLDDITFIIIKTNKLPINH